MTDDRRWIEYRPVSGLMERLDPRNPKAHDLAELRESMGRFGYTEPILLDERTGLLVAGHGRVELLAADEREGGPPPDGVLVTQGDNEWTVPVIRGWSSKNDAEAGAYLIASNRLTERGGWHADPLATLLGELVQTEDGLRGLGYGREEYEDLLAMLNPPDLDHIAKEYGEPDEKAMWPVLRLRVPPMLRQRYLDLIDGHSGDEHEQFAWVLDLAEEARATRIRTATA